MNPAVIGVVGMLLCLSSSASAALMMGGDDDDKKPATGPSATGPSTVDPRKDKTTTANDYAGGSMIHLDRHHVKCESGGLTGFSLDMQGTDKMLYNYKCNDDINGTPGALKGTGSNDWGGNNLIFLDRHTLDCGKKPISEFKLTRPASNKIEYKYKCIDDKEATGACRELDVVSTVTGKQSKTDTLMEADPQCESDEVLTKFKHYRANPDTPSESAAYKYTCCKM
jgi:hypothetical protein